MDEPFLNTDDLSDACIDQYDIGPALWAVFSDCGSDDPCLVALFLDEDMARTYIQATHPGEDIGRALVDEADLTPARLRRTTQVIVANDYRVRSHAAFLEVLKARGHSGFKGAAGDEGDEGQDG